MKRTIYDQENQCLREMTDDEVAFQMANATTTTSGEKQNGNAANKMQMSDDEVVFQIANAIIALGEKQNDNVTVNQKKGKPKITAVNKMQLRRDNSGDSYMVLYVDHCDPENGSCIILAEDGTLRKELTKIIGTWRLISDSNNEPYICDLFLNLVFKNL